MWGQGTQVHSTLGRVYLSIFFKCLKNLRFYWFSFEFGCILLGLPDLANKNTGCSVKFELQINSKLSFSVSIIPNIAWDIYIKHLLFVWISITTWNPIFYQAALHQNNTGSFSKAFRPPCLFCFIISLWSWTSTDDVAPLNMRRWSWRDTQRYCVGSPRLWETEESLNLGNFSCGASVPSPTGALWLSPRGNF